MFNEVRSFDWDKFSRMVEEHYGKQDLKVEMKFGPHGEDVRQFALCGSDGRTVRDLSPEEALDEIRKVLFPGENLRVVSVYKSRETMFGGEMLHVAVQPAG